MKLKRKNKKQLNSWGLENFEGRVVCLDSLSEEEAKAHLYEHMVAMDKMINNTQKIIDAYKKIGYCYEN